MLARRHRLPRTWRLVDNTLHQQKFEQIRRLDQQLLRHTPPGRLHPAGSTASLEADEHRPIPHTGLVYRPPARRVLNGTQYADACCRVASNTGKQTYSNDCTIQGWSCGARIRDGRNALRHTAPAAAPTSAAARLWWVAFNAYAVERITRIAPTTAGRARWRSAPRPH